MLNVAGDAAFALCPRLPVAVRVPIRVTPMAD